MSELTHPFTDTLPATREHDLRVLRREIFEREYAAWREHMEREFNCFVPSGAAEARFSRRMEAEMPALVAVEAARRAA